jgi:hypothetical protein
MADLHVTIGHHAMTDNFPHPNSGDHVAIHHQGIWAGPDGTDSCIHHPGDHLHPPYDHPPIHHGPVVTPPVVSGGNGEHHGPGYLGTGPDGHEYYGGLLLPPGIGNHVAQNFENTIGGTNNLVW